MALALLVPGSVPVSATTDFKVFAVDTTVHDLGLKAIQMQNGQIVPTSTFAIAPESVVQVKQGENLAVITSTNEPERIEKVKVSNAQGQVIDLVSLQNGQYSLSGLNVGVYALNVIANADKGKYAYETILILLAPDQQPIQKTEITKIIQKVKVFVEIDFDEEEVCQPGYVYDKRTDECVKINVCTTVPHIDKGCTPLPRPPVEDQEPCKPGGECPPCPEGEEGSHCMDEDEQQDTDDDLPEYVPPNEESNEEEENFGGDEFFDGESEEDGEEQEESSDDVEESEGDSQFD